MRVLVTGGCGFIGSTVVLHLVQELGHTVLNVDAMTYAANPLSLLSVSGNERHQLVEADICDAPRMRLLVSDFRPDAIIHLAAESHVDRSITSPGLFVRTNVAGTQSMLDAARAYWDKLPTAEKEAFRFLHVSTDEVYGSLGAVGYFTEESRYDPRSPYSASKAGSDHLARAWFETYGLPVLISNCSNNYGPRQFPEKLIPLMILNAMQRKALPVYGDGLNVRDWIHVTDHARALWAILEKGRIGDTYLVGSRSERTNRQVVDAVCAAFDQMRPDHAPHHQLISFVADRPGHDRRYAIDPSKVERETGWRPMMDFESALTDTVAWYLANESWWRPIQDGVYQGQRLGLAGRA
jgi:dTDP-glucose 4,6-dehydratase